MYCKYLGSRNRFAALAVVAALVLSPLALGGVFFVWKTETPRRYSQQAVHLLVPPGGPHLIIPPGASWRTPYVLGQGPGAWVFGFSQHMVALHGGEPPRGPGHAYFLAVPAPPGAASRNARPRHGFHPDVFSEQLVANPFFAVYTAVGSHDPPLAACPALCAALTGEFAVPPTQSEAVAACAASIFTADKTILLSIVVAGITPDQLISSAIHHGTEGDVGPVIFELGPGYEWEDLQGIGMGLMIEEEDFPEEYVEPLAHGQTYVNLCTIEHPEGEIRGQIMPAPWQEDFDLYADGTKLYHVGGWSGWDDVYDAAGTVTSAQAMSAPHSVAVSNSMGVDAVHPFSGYNAGTWEFTAYQYIPDNLDGLTYFILNNEYNHGGPYEWAVETHMDPGTGMVNEQLRDPGGGNAVPIVYDQWVEILTLIDLDANYMEHYYDGQMIASGIWNIRGGPIEIANVDLYAPHNVDVYYDNLSLEPPYCRGDVDGDGATAHSDLGVLLSEWGCTGPGCFADLDGDGTVGHSDLGILLADWGCGT